jgi:hypothetical protein
MINTTALAAAAAAAHTSMLQGHILGALGASGAALASTFVLVAGVKGKHKIRMHHQHTIATWGLITGTLYATAAGIWSAPSTITQGIAQALQNAPGGQVGLGAVALVITAIIYGFKLRPGFAAVAGIAAATIYAGAGGIWSLATSILSSTLTQLLGA